jgi:hypothetical protein
VGHHGAKFVQLPVGERTAVVLDSNSVRAFGHPVGEHLVDGRSAFVQGRRVVPTRRGGLLRRLRLSEVCGHDQL